MPMEREGWSGRWSFLERATWRRMSRRMDSSEAVLLVRFYCSLRSVTFAPAHARRAERLAYHVPRTWVRNAIGSIHFLARTPQAGGVALAVVGHFLCV